MNTTIKIVLFAAILLGLVFWSSGAVYALGGGGGHGDGRNDVVANGSPTQGAAGSSTEGAPRSLAAVGQSGDGDVGGAGFVVSSPVVTQVVVVPEPMTLLFLGLGVVGLAGIRRKLRK
jgi:hypothetical protein